MRPTLHPATKAIVIDTPVLMLPALARLIGMDDAMLLQRIHYWLSLGGHEHDGRRWIYNTYSAWAEQFPGWSKDKARRVADRLRRRGLVLTARYNRHAYDHTTWYTIDYAAVAALGIPLPDPLPGAATLPAPPPAPKGASKEATAPAYAPALPPPAPKEAPAMAPATVPAPVPPRVPAVPASVPGTPDIVCAPQRCPAEHSAESRHGDGTAATSSGTHASRYDADASRWRTRAPRCGASASRCGAFAPTIPETTTEITSEITSEINNREREGRRPLPLCV